MFKCLEYFSAVSKYFFNARNIFKPELTVEGAVLVLCQEQLLLVLTVLPPVLLLLHLQLLPGPITAEYGGATVLQSQLTWPPSAAPAPRLSSCCHS